MPKELTELEHILLDFMSIIGLSMGNIAGIVNKDNNFTKIHLKLNILDRFVLEDLLLMILESFNVMSLALSEILLEYGYNPNKVKVDETNRLRQLLFLYKGDYDKFTIEFQNRINQVSEKVKEMIQKDDNKLYM